MKIRLTGTAAEVDAMVAALVTAPWLIIAEISRYYPNRSRLRRRRTRQPVAQQVRVYLDADSGGAEAVIDGGPRS